MKGFFKLHRGEITGVICGSFYRDLLIRGVLTKLGHRTMVWSKNAEFLPCASIPLRYGCDLIELFKDLEQYFDLLMIDCLYDYFDVDNVKKFLQWIKTDEKAKEKTILIFFKQKSDIFDNAKGKELDSFVNLKDDILACSDNLYSLTREWDMGRVYWLNDLQTAKKLKMVHEGGYLMGFFKNVLD